MAVLRRNACFSAAHYITIKRDLVGGNDDRGRHTRPMSDHVTCIMNGYAFGDHRPGRHMDFDARLPSSIQSADSSRIFIAAPHIFSRL